MLYSEIVSALSKHISCLTSLWLFLYLRKKLLTNQNKLRILLKGFIFQPSQLIEALSKDDLLTSPFKSSMQNLVDNANHIVFEGFIEGIINSKEFFQSREGLKVVIQKIVKSFVYSNDRFVENPQKKYFSISVKNVPEFSLHDFNSEKTGSCVVQNLHRAQIDDGLEYLSSTTKNKQLNRLEQLAKTFYFILQLLSRNVQFRGVKTGVKISEYGAKLSSFLTIYGKLIFNKKTKELIIHQPEQFISNKTEFVYKLKRRIKWQMFGCAVVLFVLGVFVTISVKSMVDYLKKIKQALDEKKKEERLDKLRNLKEIIIDDFHCVICYKNPRNVILKPCLHFCICETCLAKLNQGLCPLCKTAIRDTVCLYVA